MNKLMIRHTMDKPLPYDAEVEYIENDGHCILNTGIIPNQNTSIVVEFYVPKVTGTIYGLWLFGGRDTNATQQMPGILIQPFDAASTAKDSWRYGNPVSNMLTYRNYGKVVVSSNRGALSITSDAGSETVTSSYTGTMSFVYPLLIMGYQTSNPTIDYSDPAIYYNTHAGTRLMRWQMYDGNTLVQDVIPVRKGNVGYAYDKITRRFLDMYRETSDNNFSAGPDYNPFEHQYLTFIPVEDAVFTWAERAVSGHLEYSINGGQTWVTIADGESTPTITAGSKVIWRGDLLPTYSTTDIANTAGIGTFSASGNYHAYGNTMSLLFYDNYYGSQLNNNLRCAFAALFYNDTHLITAPLLPATTLSIVCYRQMYTGCTNLVKASELPAATVSTYCYRNMYSNCPNINYIKCLATSLSGTAPTQNWLTGVSSTGTFVKAAGMEDWTTGASGIPNGWTVIDDPSTITT